MNENKVDDICLNISCWIGVAERWLNIDYSSYIKLSTFTKTLAKRGFERASDISITIGK